MLLLTSSHFHDWGPCRRMRWHRVSEGDARRLPRVSHTGAAEQEWHKCLF